MTTRLTFVRFALAAAFLLSIRSTAAAGAGPDEGFRPLFDGQTLAG